MLRVNLTSGEIKKEPLNTADASNFVGARGLGTNIICDEVDPATDPLGPDNKLIFMTGPLTGTFAACAGRYNMVSKVPLTGTIGAANSGGHFGPKLKFAGYDGIAIEGACEKPVYLCINDDEVEMRDAAHFWGKTVYETADIINSEVSPQAKVACIGPAGEKQVLFATVMNDKSRAAGRGGMGAVMGSKKLKAVAVCGTGSVTVARKDEFMAAAADARAKLKAHPVAGTGLPAYGTNILVNIINAARALPTCNWRDGGEFAEADDIGGESLAKKCLVRNKGCFSCCIGCGRQTRILDGPFKSVGEGSEYEAAWAYGASCGVSNLAAICKASFLCNEYGMDPISLGATIACTMELAEKGAISAKEIGRALAFGDAEGIVALTEQVGKFEDFGKELAKGSFRMAEKYGLPRTFNVGQKTGNARLRQPRRARHRPGIRDKQSRRLPCAQLHDRPGTSGRSRKNGSARHRRQGADAQTVSRPNRASRFPGQLPVHNLRQRFSRICSTVSRGGRIRRNRRGNPA